LKVWQYTVKQFFNTNGEHKKKGQTILFEQEKKNIELVEDFNDIPDMKAWFNQKGNYFSRNVINVCAS
jgi:hypothetical protein